MTNHNKNIFYIANIRLPTERAHGAQIMKMCEAFAKEGIKVELVVPIRKTHIQEETFSYYGVEPLFSIQRLWSLDTVRWGKIGFLTQEITFSVSAWFFLLHKKGLIYGRNPLSLMLSSLFQKRQRVWEVHDGRWNIITRCMSRSATHIVAISEGLRDFYISKGVSQNKIIVAHDGVDLDQIEQLHTKQRIRKHIGIPHDIRIAMYIGMLTKEKGYATLLEASKMLPHTIQIVIIGKENPYVEAKKKEYKNILFLGPKPYRDVGMYQKAADVLVIPNSGKSEKEGVFTSPLKLFTAMASRVPIVASRVPALTNVLNSDEAIFFDPDNPESLAQAIQQASVNKEVAERAYKKVTKYTWKHRAEKILSFL